MFPPRNLHSLTKELLPQETLHSLQVLFPITYISYKSIAFPQETLAYSHKSIAL